MHVKKCAYENVKKLVLHPIYSQQIHLYFMMAEGTKNISVR